MHITVISDGRPGHYSQSRGLVRLLEQHRHVTLDWREFPIRHKWLRAPLQGCLNQQLWTLAKPMLQAVYGPAIEQPLEANTNIVIGAGGNTRFLLAWLGARYGVNTAYLGSLRGLKPSLLGRIMTLEDLQLDNNIVMPMAPVDIDLQSLSEQGHALRKCLNTEKPLYLMVIGGDRPDCRYEKNDWQQLASAMSHIAQRDNIQWLLTTSPRTGESHERALRAAIDSKLLAQATWFATDPSSVMSAYMGAAQRIFVTQDSSTMLTEAVASNRPVLALAPKKCHLEQRHAAFLNRLHQKGLIQHSPIAQVAQVPLSVSNNSIGEVQHNIVNALLRYIDHRSHEASNDIIAIPAAH